MLLENRLAALRKQVGLSQQDLAERLHVSRQAVSRWESGESMPTVDNLLYLSSIFGVSVDFLLKGDEAHPETERPAPAQTPLAPIEATPRRVQPRLKGIILAACAVCIIIILLLYVFLPAKSTTDVIPLEDIPGEVVDLSQGSTFSLN